MSVRWHEERWRKITVCREVDFFRRPIEERTITDEIHPDGLTGFGVAGASDDRA